ncbi:MAG: FAD-dependent oxidoreductase, partial [Kingella sp. (in: b-proteobacteria)]
VIVATGSVPRGLPSLVEIDNKNVLDNEGALNLTEVPQKLGVIGSGVIGLEMGSVWNRVGSQVTILEAAPVFLPAADQQIAKEALKYFTKEQGLTIELGVKINKIDNNANGVTVEYEVSGSLKTETFDKLIIAIGRVPTTQGLNAQAVGLAIDERGFVVVNENCQTNLPNVWAIGDVVRGPMLAHKASEEGVAVAERIVGQKPHVDLAHVPFVIYTDPEIAWVGKTEEQLKAEGVEYKKGTSGFGANGRALGLGKAKGTIKVLADAKTDRILGVHMIGPMVSELIAEAVAAVEFKASSEDIARIVHAHPTLSEVFHEAALAVDKRALHC